MLVTVFFLDKLLVADLGFPRFYFSFVITFFISIYEISSVFENLVKIRPDITFLSTLLTVFRGMGEKTLKAFKKRSDDIIESVTAVPEIPASSLPQNEIAPAFTGATETLN